MLRFVDKLRAGLFIRSLNQGLEKLSVFLKEHFPTVNREAIVESLAQHFAIELDQHFLPIVAWAIAEKKQAGDLPGIDTNKQYEFFFTPQNAHELMVKFPFLFTMRDVLIEKTIGNIMTCLTRLMRDSHLLKRSLWCGMGHESLAAVHISGGDFHDGEQALILEFTNGTRLAYKPTSLAGVPMIQQVVGLLGFPSPFDLYIPKILDRGRYGWMEYVEFRESRDEEDVRHHFTRYGSLLAFAEAMMFSDLLYSNVVCRHGKQPAIVDFETWPCPAYFEVTYPIEHTLVIQRPEKDANGFTHVFSAIQSFGYYLVNKMHPYPKNGTERTSDLEVELLWLEARDLTNNPITASHYISPREYIDEVVQGYAFAYNEISRKANSILRLHGWWERVARLRQRAIMRPTMLYSKLWRLAEQPICSDRHSVESLFRAELESNGFPEIVAGEISSLTQLDVPYFQHIPSEPHLYAGKSASAGRIENFFREPAIMLLRKNLLNRSATIRDGNVDLVRTAFTESAPSIPRRPI